MLRILIRNINSDPDSTLSFYFLQKVAIRQLKKLHTNTIRTGRLFVFMVSGSELANLVDGSGSNFLKCGPQHYLKHAISNASSIDAPTIWISSGIL